MQAMQIIIYINVIKVRFPKENDTNAEYSDLIEYIKLDLSAKQIID